MMRTCGICGVADIPRGVEWRCWYEGRPVHPRCLQPGTEITVEQIFYRVLALADHSELLPLARALRAVELHIRRGWQRAHSGAITRLYAENFKLRGLVNCLWLDLDAVVDERNGLLALTRRSTSAMAMGATGHEG